MLVENLICGNSLTAALTRSLDWTQTVLGPVGSWTEALLNAVNMLLAAPTPMQLFWGPEFICIYNDAMTPALSDKHPRSLGQPARVVWSEAWDMIGPQMQHVYATGEAVSFKNALVPLMRNGVLEDCYWTYSYSPVFDKAGKVVGVIDIALDTTEVVLAERAEQTRSAKERRLAAFTVATNDVFYQMNADWSSMSELDGRNFLADTRAADPDWLRKYVPAMDQQRLLARIHSAVSTKTTFELEHRVVRDDGTVGWTLSRAIPILNEAGEVDHWLGAARDISGRKRNEEEIREGRMQLLFALDAASLAAWYYDPQRGVVGGDARMATLFGLSESEAPAEVWLAAIVEEDRERVRREFAASVAGEPYDTEYRVLVEGQTRWIRARAKLVADAEMLTRMLGICEDITEQKRAQSRRRATLERLALAQQVGNIAAWEWDLHTGRFTWDAAGAWVYGRSPSELNNLESIQKHIHRDDLARVAEGLVPALSGEGEFNLEFRACWPDGSHHWLIGKGRPITDELGRVARLNGVNIDITERRIAEMALRQSEKLAAVGQLASTIAHEINNPLEAVTNLLYLARGAAAHDPVLSGYLDTAEVELRRVSAITSQTLRFHKQLTRPTQISCTDLFSNALLIFQGRIENAGIRVEKRKRAERPVTCLEGEIRQVMNNLIGNAIDAMKQGGRLLVRSAEATDWRTGRAGLRLTVADTGIGMSRKTLSHIFQAFFTTKGISGTGLGLWVSQEIVQRHEGRLTVRSSDRTGRSGTVFHLFLPFPEQAQPAGQERR